MLSRVRVRVCMRISAARSEADSGACLSAVFRVRKASAQTGWTKVFPRTHTRWDCQCVCLFVRFQILASVLCKWQPLAWFTLASAVMTAIGCGQTWQGSTSGPVSSGSAHRCVTGSLRLRRRLTFLTSLAQSCAAAQCD